MKRSEINQAYLQAKAFFEKNGWSILPHFKWDVTDFGLGNFSESGLVLINLCEEVEYCEKLMFATKNMLTPAHFHKSKKEDIICRTGQLEIELWNKGQKPSENGKFHMKINGEIQELISGQKIILNSGERITIQQGIWHAFKPISEECIIGEVSTANDDANDNFFDNPNIGRYPEILEDEKPLIRLLSDK
jgi:D-lyxose ketol-isomerase